jgi:hypothetical protein
MVILIFKIIIYAVGGVFNSWGGYNFLAARRFIWPFAVGGAVSIITVTWWLGLLCLPSMGTLCLGYFKGDNFGHGLRWLLCGIAMWLGVTILGHLSWFIFIPHVILCGVLCGFSKNWNQRIGDAICGCFLTLPILFVR